MAPEKGAHRIVFLGPPGSGKGTQARLLMSQFGLEHISTGAMLRSEIESGTPLGLQAQGYIENGQLAPDQLVRTLAEKALKTHDCQQFILDGYPRTVQQAIWLCEFMDSRSITISAAVNFIIDREEVVARLSQRRINYRTGENFHLSDKPPPQDQSEYIITRKDDQPDAIRKRLNIYHERTHPLVDYYSDKKLLVPVDAKASFTEVNEQICNLLKLE
ncbi:MAG: adenylate kinase [Bacteroidetes bacterium]|nr:adenylate kinase [Bacteroidota bacterium]